MVLFPKKSHSNCNDIFGILHPPKQVYMCLFPQVVLERGLLSLLLQVRYPDFLAFFLQDRPLLYSYKWSYNPYNPINNPYKWPKING